jgi:hypothetical protein
MELLNELINLNDIYDIIFYRPSSKKNNGEISNRARNYIEAFNKSVSDDDSDHVKYKWHVPWSKVFSRSFLIDNHIYFDEVIAANDVMFSVKSGHFSNNIFFSKIKFYTVIDREGSLTKQKSNSVLRSRLYVNYQYNKFLISVKKI